MSQNLEQFYPPIQSDGLNTGGNASIGGTLAVTGAVTLSSTLAGIKNKVIDATANTTLTAAQSGSIVLLDAAAGVEVDLPAAAAGLNYLVLVATTPTSNTIGVRCAGSDKLYGALVSSIAGGTSATFVANGNTVITMNGTTTGGSVGTFINLVGIAAAKWQVEGQNIGSGALATPFA